ncbi:MAG: WD40 repeat domain-containing protein [Planctomycetes bacterium]|nr:WD40 repeat domain-containing protein [Planctomycetota bacterium]
MGRNSVRAGGTSTIFGQQSSTERPMPVHRDVPSRVARAERLLPSPCGRGARFAVGCLLCALAIVSSAAPSKAAKVKVWHHASAGHYDKAQFKQTVISSEGSLRLANKLRLFASLPAAHIWAAAEDKAGNLWIATGDEGKLFKLTADGKITLAYTSNDGQILSLAIAPDGTVYAGSGPGGQIIAVPPQGAARIVADKLGSYVWALVYDPTAKTLLAGTGPKGQIFQVTPEGKTSVFYSTRQDHILSLARGADNMLYAGTDKGGLVYRIDPAGKGFVLYDAHQGEIHALLASPDGLYAGTSAPVQRGSRGFNSAGSGNPAVSLEKPPFAIDVPKKTQTQKKKTKAAIDSADGSTGGRGFAKGDGASPGSSPGAGDNSIYRIAADGTVREIFRDKVMALSLLARKDKLLAGTGMRGQLFEIDEATKERTELARLEHGQVSCLLARNDGSILVAGSDPGKLYVLEDGFAARGAILSDVLDTKITSNWGAATWKASTPEGTSVSVAFRAGNIADPDATWSDWSAELMDPADAKITLPAARYLQFRVTLASTDAKSTPEVRGVTVRYKNTNLPPEITSLDLPDLAASNLDNSRKIKVRWTAIDPNEDELFYRVYIRKEGWKDWLNIEDEHDKKDYEWDTTTFPAGFYQVKVTASDRRDNAPEEALTATRISRPIAVAHTPPTVTLKTAGMDGDQVIIEAAASDPLVRLTEASFSIDGKKSSSIFPRDGLFDGKTETFRFKTGPLSQGTHVLILRVRNAAGLVGSGDVVFVVRAKPN